MNDTDKELLKSSALVVADDIVSMVPGLNIAWGLTKSLYGSGLKLRQQRALEWVEMVRDNPNVFTEEVLQTEAFQDAFVYCAEQYITERNEEKRRYVKDIFLGYAAAGDYENFPLERLLMTLQQLSNKDVETLKDVDLDQAETSNYQIYIGSDKNIDNIANLIQLGILRQDGTAQIRDSYAAPTVQITAFGKEFIAYVVS